MLDEMPRKKYKERDFQERLAGIRKARGLTQVRLAKAINSTQRAISHYENESAYPPAPVVVKLAKALRVTTDELLGVKPVKVEKQDPDVRRLWKKFVQIQTLPVKDQRAIIRMVNSLVNSGKKR
jgi:transcriptional regulator with XRE-family HTH domain